MVGRAGTPVRSLSRHWFDLDLLGLYPRLVDGLGEDNAEDKPYCDVAMDEVIPAVKTLIRAVRSVPKSRGQEVKFF